MKVNFNQQITSQRFYQGFSPELSREVLYRLDHGQDFQAVLNEIRQSNTLYIHKLDQKEYFHIIPLTHLQCELSRLILYLKDWMNIIT